MAEPSDESKPATSPQAETEATVEMEPEASDATDKAGSFGAVFLTTFTTVFLAELGDKTQLAALLLSAESGRPVLVFVGASLA
ncbi:MAG: hypothetical protein RLZZ255_353, partial [Cyanobacteriota bacterium]